MTDPVPRHIARHWRGYADQARNTLIRYKKYSAIYMHHQCVYTGMYMYMYVL